MQAQLSVHDVIAALEPVRQIRRPEGDNEGDPINSEGVYPYLSASDQSIVDAAYTATYRYVRRPDNMGSEPNTRAITELSKHGYRASLNVDQYDPMRLVGQVQIGEWVLDLSDR